MKKAPPVHGTPSDVYVVKAPPGAAPPVASPTAPPVPTPPAPAPFPAVPPVQAVPPPAANAPPTQLVLLADGKLVEGVTTVTAEKVTVKAGALDRTFPKAQVEFVGASKDEVYRHMLAKTDAADPAARLKLAKWCM